MNVEPLAPVASEGRDRQSPRRRSAWGRDDDDETSLGWVEIALPLWHRRWRLLAGALIAALLAGALSMAAPVRFASRASFVVVPPVMRPSQIGVANAIPALAGLVGGGPSAIDQQVAILRSELISDRIIQRFDLQRAWNLPSLPATRARLYRSTDIVAGRREGVVYVTVEDGHPQRAAAIATQLVLELRATLLSFALDEARQRRSFYEAQLVSAREALEKSRRALQEAGFDRAALRAEPRAVADGYVRVQGEIAAAEIRLATLRRARAEGSAEVQQQLSELQAMRAQLAQQEAPRGVEGGTFIARMREFRQAEVLLDGLARQAEAARVDEAAEPLPLQMLDQATVPLMPTSPRPILWIAGGAVLALLLQSAWVLVRYRRSLASANPAYQLRLAQLHAALPPRRGRKRS